MPKELVAVLRCSRCQHELLIQVVDAGDGGTFTIGNLPSVCSNAECMAGFKQSQHALEVTMYGRVGFVLGGETV